MSNQKASSEKSLSTCISEEQEQWICPQPRCGKVFKDKHKLRSHFRKHTSYAPYQCMRPDCMKRFKWRSSIRHHRINVHPLPSNAATTGSGHSRRDQSCSSSLPRDEKCDSIQALKHDQPIFLSSRARTSRRSLKMSAKKSCSASVSQIPTARKGPVTPSVCDQNLEQYLHNGVNKSAELYSSPILNVFEDTILYRGQEFEFDLETLLIDDFSPLGELRARSDPLE